MALTLPDLPLRPREGPGWREQAVELAVFLFLILPSLVLSLFAVRQGSLSFVLVAVPGSPSFTCGAAAWSRPS